MTLVTLIISLILTLSPLQALEILQVVDDGMDLNYCEGLYTDTEPTRKIIKGSKIIEIKRHKAEPTPKPVDDFHGGASA